MEEFINELEKIKREEIPFDSKVKSKFTEIYGMKFGHSTAGRFYEEQSSLARDVIISSEELKKCSGFSVFNAFLNLAINGLSLEKNSSTQCYIEPRKVAIGTKMNMKDNKMEKVWESRAVLKISGYGELLIRQRAGQIVSICNPVIVYDCDKFEYGEDDAGSHISYTKKFPRTPGAKIIAGYVKIIKPNDLIDYKVMDLDDVKRLIDYSIKNNSKYDYQHSAWITGKPNPLYGKNGDGSDIDTGFFSAKIIKHAFKTFPRISIGDGAVMMADEEEIEVDKAKEYVEPFGENISQADGVKIETDVNDEAF